MSLLAGGLRVYAEVALLLSLISLAIPVISRCTGSARFKLRLAQALIGLAIALPFLATSLPRGEFREAKAQVFNGKAGGGSLVIPLPTSQGTQLELPIPSSPVSVLTIALLIGVMTSLGWWIRELHRLYRFLGSALTLRRVGRAHVVVSDLAAVPFSARLPYAAYVVVPTRLIDSTLDFRIAVQHEMAHHRSHDPEWALFASLLRRIFFWNPLLHGGTRLIAELQEFACDHSLIGHERVNAQAYSRCLIRAAEYALDRRHDLVGTAGIVTRSGELLKRRIEMIMKSQHSGSRALASVIAVGTALGLSAIALASRGMVRAGGLEMSEAMRIARATSPRSDLPIVMTPEVLRELNYFVADPKGREFTRKALKRKPAYEAMIDAKIAQYGLPQDLDAIPLMESGYLNRPAGISVGAGLWMFIESTARAYGLIVTPELDEREDEVKETDAAMRYLSYLHGLHHGDWWLALASYNQGENHVLKQIEESGVRDPWRLVEMGRLNSYTSQIMAAVLILKNASLQP